jgi:hypothetical protein
MRGRGLFPRCLFGVPASLVGWRRPDPATVRPGVRRAYSDLILALASKICAVDPRGEYVRHRLGLSGEAHDVRRDFATSLEHAMRRDGDLYLVRDWANKAVGRAIRIAALQHLARYASESAPWEIPLSATAMKAGVAVVRYGVDHFMAAMGLASGRPADRFAQEGSEFLVSALYQSKRRSFEDSVENMDLGLAELERRNYIRPLERERRGDRGRLPNPRSRWAIHPKVRTQNTEKRTTEGETAERGDSLDSLYAPPASDVIDGDPDEDDGEAPYVERVA